MSLWVKIHPSHLGLSTVQCYRLASCDIGFTRSTYLVCESRRRTIRSNWTAQTFGKAGILLYIQVQ